MLVDLVGLSLLVYLVGLDSWLTVLVGLVGYAHRKLTHMHGSLLMIELPGLMRDKAVWPGLDSPTTGPYGWPKDSRPWPDQARDPPVERSNRLE